MSSRLQEKERRRAKREARERDVAEADWRRRARRTLASVAIGALVIGMAIAVAIASRGGDTKPQTATSAAAADGPFGQHYAGLSQRRQAAGVPTMMDTMSSRVHFHPQLTVYANGKQVHVPPNIGIDPSQDAMQMADLHTHDASGTIHVEGLAGARLGQFFQVWGVPLSPRRLGPYRAAGNDVVRMWVDGKPSTAFGRLRLADRQRIVVSFGRRNAPPPGD